MCEKLTLREHLIMATPIARQSRKIKGCAGLGYTLEASLFASEGAVAVAMGQFVQIGRLI